MKNQFKIIAILFSIVAVVSCKEKTSYTKVPAPTVESTEKVLHKIVVKEYKDGGSYAYINVEEDGKEYWMAIPNMEVTIGNTYYYEGGMIMKDFESKQLQKTFDFITFADAIRTTEANIEVAEVPDSHQHQTGAEIHSAVEIDKPDGAIWIKDLFESMDTHANKEVLVRGQVVKVNEAILGKNWIHLVDGTAFNGEKDLTITSDEKPVVGEIYNFKGTIVLDKDFGQGYVYKIIMENAVIVK